MGADGVEIDARSELTPGELSHTGLRQFRKLLADFRLQVSAVAFPTRRGYDDAEDLERRLMATQAAMRMAYELGAGIVVNRVGNVPSTSDHPAFKRLVEALTMLGAYGERIGARFAATTGREPPADLARLIADLPGGMIGVDLHPRGLIDGGHPPATTLEELGRHVLHVHASDAVRDGAAGQTVDVELGRGMADLPELLARLQSQFDYRGWVTIESRTAANPREAIENAVAYLRAL
jgi:sugar phosphate isomerase/epimerase